MKKVNCILLIDDDEATNHLHTMILKNLDLYDKIEVAENGKKGLDFIKLCHPKDLPELILLDINMPLMDGFQFLEEYQKLDPSRRLPSKLIMVSTSSNQKEVSRAMEHKELYGYLDKPLKKNEILEIWSDCFN